jgi:uncharacterized membrane protein YqhA
VPEWLEIHDLDDLKHRLVSVIIVILGVQFLAQVLSWNGNGNLLPYGAAIAVVILALGLFLGQQHKNQKSAG